MDQIRHEDDFIICSQSWSVFVYTKETLTIYSTSKLVLDKYMLTASDFMAS